MRAIILVAVAVLSLISSTTAEVNVNANHGPKYNEKINVRDVKEPGDVKPSKRCTTIGVSPGGMVGGAAITTHNNDCQECDIRITHVPAQDWPEVRAINEYKSYITCADDLCV